MTITIQGAPAEEEEDTALLDLFLPPVCDGLPFEDECKNKAVYKCDVSCCRHILFWCEECLFEFIEWARENNGGWGRCIYCDARLRIRVDHVTVIGRL